MCVALDESGRDITSAGIVDLLARFRAQIGSDFYDDAIANADVGGEGIASGAINDDAAFDQPVRICLGHVGVSSR